MVLNDSAVMVEFQGRVDRVGVRSLEVLGGFVGVLQECPFLILVNNSSADIPNLLLVTGGNVHGTLENIEVLGVVRAHTRDVCAVPAHRRSHLLIPIKKGPLLILPLHIININLHPPPLPLNILYHKRCVPHFLF